MTQKRGKPVGNTLMNDEVIRQARVLAELGLTDKQMARTFDVSEMTLNVWKKKHPAFKEALDKGKAIADEKVERSLYERACGYEHPEDYIAVSQGKVITQETTKHYPPDTTACIYWLKNRKPDKWRDKTEQEVSHRILNVVGMNPIGGSNDQSEQ
jgi:DNA-binding transcriptional regulator YiaG